MEAENFFQAVYLISLLGLDSTRSAAGTAGVESAKIAAL
jgi:hypothetical protein